MASGRDHDAVRDLGDQALRIGTCAPQRVVVVSEHQPSMYFRLGGGTIKGISKPGEIVWSRIFVDSGVLKVENVAAQDRDAGQRTT